jgi:ABC-type multidrug transport system fused ATPase/permease subunit
LPGTFEYNLNPQGVAIDVKELETALQKVQLSELITKRGGLGSQLQQDSLSHGEQQLLALARAIVRKNLAGGRCILVLDEATSNLDPATEAIVKDIIKEDFKDNTVITVAHRLHTMHNCDIVLVLEKGKVIDIGSPDKIIDAERAIVSNKEAEKH